jgi:hypothetical protein
MHRINVRILCHIERDEALVEHIDAARPCVRRNPVTGAAYNTLEQRHQLLRHHQQLILVQFHMDQVEKEFHRAMDLVRRMSVLFSIRMKVPL